MGRELTLKKALREVAAGYDVVLIDCPPALGLLTVNALVASHYALISSEAQYFALQGVEQALEVIELARDSLNPDLEWLGVVLNIADMRTRHSREAFESLREHFGHKLIETTIRASIAYAESAERAVSILDYRPDLGVDYLDVADDLLTRLGLEDARKPLRQAEARRSRRRRRPKPAGHRVLTLELTQRGTTRAVTTESAAVSPARSRPSPVLVVGILGVLTFALIPIRINTIYSGLPAHPLFLHVPVILIPVVGIAALGLAARPAWWGRHGVWVTALAVVALGALNLTMGAGKALRADLGVPIAGFGGAGGQAALIARHEHAADLLRIFMILFTAVLIVSLAVYRAESGLRIAALDRLLAGLRDTAAATIALRAAMAVLAVLCLYLVFHTGDLGAKAVWQGRVHGGGFGGPPGAGGVGSLFGGGGGGGGGG